jgi:selenocysteine-specific elongation factor
MRAAVALAGAEPSAIGRGATLVADAAWEATLVLRATVRLLPNAPELRPRTRVRLHLATSEVGARVVAAGGPVQPDSTRTVRVVLDEPIVARGGDRFVLRSASPLATIGGGVVTDANAPRRARPMPSAALSAAQRLELIVAESGTHGLLDASIPVRLGGSPTVVREVSRGASGIEQIGDRWYSTDVLAQARERIVALVRAHRDSRPLEPGLPRQDARSRLRLESTLFDRLVADLNSSGKLESSGAELRLAGGAPALSDAHSKVLAELAGAIEAAGSEPPSVSELQARFGPQTLSLLRHLERDQRVVQVEQTRYYAPGAWDDGARRAGANRAQGIAGLFP